jgi:hypothetical protein
MSPRDEGVIQASLNAITEFYFYFIGLGVEDVLNLNSNLPIDRRIIELVKTKRKSDTIPLDALAESALAFGIPGTSEGHLELVESRYGLSPTLLTEESGILNSERLAKLNRGDLSFCLDSLKNQKLKLFCDPVDGSSALSETLQRNLGWNIQNVFEKELEERGRSSAFINSPTTSISLQKDKRFIYSIVLNWFTGEILLAYEKGVYQFPVKRGKTLDELTRLQQVEYSPRCGTNILCYTKPGEYQDNFDMFFLGFRLQQGFTTGPNRGCYLMREFVGAHNIEAGGYNREKLTESA